MYNVRFNAMPSLLQQRWTLGRMVQAPEAKGIWWQRLPVPCTTWPLRLHARTSERIASQWRNEVQRWCFQKSMPVMLGGKWYVLLFILLYLKRLVSHGNHSKQAAFLLFNIPDASCSFWCSQRNIFTPSGVLSSELRNDTLKAWLINLPSTIWAKWRNSNRLMNGDNGGTDTRTQ